MVNIFKVEEVHLEIPTVYTFIHIEVNSDTVERSDARFMGL